MKGFLIDPYEKTVVSVHLDNYTEQEESVGGPLREGLTFPSEDILYVNEEGFTIPDVNFFAVKGFGGEVFRHYGLVIGENKDVSMSLRELKRQIVYVFPEDAFSGKWKNEVWIK